MYVYYLLIVAMLLTLQVGMARIVHIMYKYITKSKISQGWSTNNMDSKDGLTKDEGCP